MAESKKGKASAKKAPAKKAKPPMDETPQTDPTPEPALTFTDVRDSIESKIGQRIITLNHRLREDGVVTGGSARGRGFEIKWQDGPIEEGQPNGALLEDVLAVALHRLQTVNTAGLRNRHSSLAATAVEEATLWLDARQRDRKGRGVANTYKP